MTEKVIAMQPAHPTADPAAFVAEPERITNERALSTAVGRLHWAGSETTGICMGSMDGATRSGKRVAAEVTDALSTHPATAAAE